MITLPWFPNGDLYSPPSSSIYHNYYGDYYQIYDLYMTNTQDIGRVLAKAMSFPGVEILTMDHVFCQRYTPYKIPGYHGQCYLEFFYNLIRDWGTLDPHVLEIYLFGGESDAGYFTEEGHWRWVKDPSDIPPERKRWPGILREGEKLYECTIEYPIPLPKGTRIHYLSLYGDSIHWLFDVVKDEEGWNPKYPPLIGGVIAIGGNVPSCLQYNTFPVPNTSILGNAKRYMRRIRMLFLEESIPKRVKETYRLVQETCNGSPLFTVHYPLITRIICNGERSQSNLSQYAELARQHGITPFEYYLAYVLNIPHIELISTRSSSVFDSYIASLSYGSPYSDAPVPVFTVTYSSPWGRPLRPYIYVDTVSTTNPQYRYSSFAAAPIEQRGWHMVFPANDFVAEVLAGRYVRYDGTVPLAEIDERTLMVDGYIILPPNPPLRLLGFFIPGERVASEVALIDNTELQVETRRITAEGDADESTQISDFDHEFYRYKYYHCIVYANNNVWGKQSSADGSIGRLPGFYKRKDDDAKYQNIVLSPDYGDEVLDPEFLGNISERGFCFDASRKIKVPVEENYPRNYVRAGICSAWGQGSCSTTRVRETELPHIKRGCVYDIKEILEYYEFIEVENTSKLVRFPNPKLAIDSHFLDYVLENELDSEKGKEIFVLRNYTMPDSPRVVEMHLAAKEIADCLSAKEMAYYPDPESGQIPDDPTQRKRLAGNLAWHIMMLCKWNGIQVLDDKNIAHSRGIDRFPIQVVDAEGTGTKEVQGHYPFGVLAFSNEDMEGKISQIPGYPPSDTSRPQMAYKLKSSEFKEDRTGDLRIAPGGYVIVNTIQQLLQVMMQDLDKALGMEDLSAAVVPGTAKDEVCAYEGLGAAIAELIHMSSHISSHTSQNLISNIITQGIVRELLKATGFPLVGKTVNVDVGGQENVSIPYPGIPDSSPTHYLMFVSLMQTLQPIVASVLEKVSESITKGDIAFKDND